MGAVRERTDCLTVRSLRLPRLTISGSHDMNRLFAALGAGWGAKKLGGGCFTTVLIFLLLYWLLRGI
jgi:hypothetical protein